MDNSHQLRDKTVCLDLGKALYVHIASVPHVPPVAAELEKPVHVHRQTGLHRQGKETKRAAGRGGRFLE